MIEVRLQRLAHGVGLPLPAYATPGAAGLDLHAALPEGELAVIAPLGRLLVPTGVAVQLAPGHEAQVRPRSGLALRHGLTVLNAPGTVDEDYRGEVQVLLVNLGAEPVTLRRGMRIAQLVISRVALPEVMEVAELQASARGSGGFGSTGL